MTEQAAGEQTDSEHTGGEQAGTGQADTGQASTRRAALVAAAQEQWTAALTDLGGRNTLLYYKDRRAGTLDLAAADPQALLDQASDVLFAAKPLLGDLAADGEPGPAGLPPLRRGHLR